MNTDSLTKALKILLKPAVTLAVRRGLKVQDLFEALKCVFVVVAENELKRAGESHSKSRIAVITGLQRRDISRLMEDDQSGAKSVNILIKVIGHWGSDRRFCLGDKPRDLTFEGIQSEFFTLVQAVSKDLNPYTLLFELERIGAVEKVGSLLRLKSRSFEPRDNPEQGWTLWSQDVSDLIDSVEENLDRSDEIPHLHISTRYDNVVKAQIPALRRWLLEKGAEFHAQVRAHLSQFDKDLNPALYDQEGGGKVSLSSFSRSLSQQQVSGGESDE